MINDLRDIGSRTSITVHDNINIEICDNHDDPNFHLTPDEIDIIRDTLEKLPPDAVRVQRIFTLPESMMESPPCESTIAFVFADDRFEMVLYVSDSSHDDEDTAAGKSRFIFGRHEAAELMKIKKDSPNLKFAFDKKHLATAIIHENAHFLPQNYKEYWINLLERSGDDIENFPNYHAHREKKWEENQASIHECLAGNGINFIDRAHENMKNGKPVLLEYILLAFAETFILPGNDTGQHAILRLFELRSFGEYYLQPLDLPINVTSDGWVELGDLFRYKLDDTGNRIIGFQRIEIYDGFKQVVDEHYFEGNPIETPFVDEIKKSNPTSNPASPVHEIFQISEEFDSLSKLLEDYPILREEGFNLSFSSVYSSNPELYLYPNFPVFHVVEHGDRIAVAIRAVYTGYFQNGFGVTPLSGNSTVIHSALWFLNGPEFNPNLVNGQIKRLALNADGRLIIDFFDIPRVSIPVEP
ncbi:MAG: hypothetical protein ABII23_04415, partial [bacterium]